MLTGIEKLSLMQQLPELMKEQATASAMDRLQIGLKISQIMSQLGYSSKAAPVADNTVIPPAEPAPVPEQPVAEDNSAQKTDPQPAPESGAGNDVPQLVTDFLGGKFTNASQDDMIGALKGIAPYIGQFLTLDQAKAECTNWFNAGGYSM